MFHVWRVVNGIKANIRDTTTTKSVNKRSKVCMMYDDDVGEITREEKYAMLCSCVLNGKK